MPAMFGGTPIGAMQYGGTPIAEAMIDGVVVWRRIITVTPQAPTFLDEAPWIELPTVEGVTYTVQGTPGYNASVTVTATADEGYELVGAASWSHTYGPPPRYQASNSGGQFQADRNTWRTVTTHTVNAVGVTSGTWSVVWERAWNVTYTSRVIANGVVIAEDSVQAPQSNNWRQQVNIPQHTVSSGDIITFQIRGPDNSSVLYRRISSWSWSLA